MKGAEPVAATTNVTFEPRITDWFVGWMNTTGGALIIRLRTLTAALKGEQPGPEASIRKIMADEHGQHVMSLVRDMIGANGMLTGGDGIERFVPGTDTKGLGPERPAGGLMHPGWYDGYMFSQALTIGGGTGEVQRNIVAERVLGLPHDVNVNVGMSWSESQRAVGRAS